MNALAADALRALNRNRASFWLAQTAIIAGLVLFYWPTWVELSSLWLVEAGPYSHAPIILAVCIYYLYSNAAVAGAGSASGIHFLPAAALLVSSCVWFAASVMSILLFQALMLPAMLYFAIATLRGWEGARAALFPGLYFMFIVPGWDYLTPLLQKLTIFVSTALLGFMRIPALIDGPYVTLPYGTFEIAAGCAGLHFFNSALALSTLYAWVVLRSRRLQLALVGIVTAMAIAMNWVRVTAIIVVGYRTQMQNYLVQVDHYFFGWLLFAVMLVPCYLVARKIEQIDVRSAGGTSPERAIRYPSWSRRNSRTLGVTLAILAIVPVSSHVLAARQSAPPLASLVLPAQLGNWRRQAESIADWGGRFNGADDEDFARYNVGGSELLLYANRYRAQSQGAELVNDSNHFFDTSNFRVVGSAVTPVSTENGDQFDINLTDIYSHDGRRFVLAHWYYVGDRITTGGMQTKLLEGWATVAGGAPSGAVVVSSRCDSDCSVAHNRVTQFVADNLRELRKMTGE